MFMRCLNFIIVIDYSFLIPDVYSSTWFKNVIATLGGCN